MVPSWLGWLEWLIWPLFVVTLVLVVFFSFTLVTHLIAAPFYGFLAAKVEAHETGRPPQDERGLVRTGIDASRPRAGQARLYSAAHGAVVRAELGAGVNLLAPPLWLAFSAWVMAITYLDYPMDNNAVSFTDMRRRLRRRWWPTLTYRGLGYATDLDSAGQPLSAARRRGRLGADVGSTLSRAGRAS